MSIKASELAPDRGTKKSQRALLHGSDLPRNTREVTLSIVGIRKAPPGWGSPLLLDFEPQFDKGSLPLNVTNIRSLGALCTEAFGDDDLERLIGCSIIFQVVQDNNPQTGEMVSALRVAPGGLVGTAKGGRKKKGRPKKS